MDAVNKLLDRTGQLCSASSDAALARHFGVTPNAVYNWRKGRAYPDTVTCGEIARITGEPLARVLGIVGEARAISREEKAVWRRLAGIAAAVMVATLISTAAAPATAANKQTSYTLCEVVAWIGRFLRRLAALAYWQRRRPLAPWAALGA